MPRTSPSAARATEPSVERTPVLGRDGPGSRRTSRLLAVSLVMVDVLLLVANVLHLRADARGDGEAAFAASSWNGGLDGSTVELFGHVQLTVAVAGLVSLWLRRRVAVYGAWAVVLAVVVADDLLMLHERLASRMLRALDPPVGAGLRPQDVGELTVWAVAVAVLAPPLVLAHRQARDRDRRRSWTLVALVGVLGGFAVVVDMLQSVLARSVPPGVETAMTLLETAGELGAMTAVVVAVHAMATGPDAGHRRRDPRSAG